MEALSKLDNRVLLNMYVFADSETKREKIAECLSAKGYPFK